MSSGRYWGARGKDGDLHGGGLQLVYGCSHVSPGCDHCCHADADGHRNGSVTVDHNALNKIYMWRPNRRPTRFAILNDLHHGNVPISFIDAAYKTFALQKRHRFMVLTKRASSMLHYWGGRGRVPDNVALGVTVESQDYADRVRDLCEIDCACRFVSVEPMLGPVNLERWLYYNDVATGEPVPSHRIHWVVCGGETGPGARPMHPDWVRDLRDQCVDAGVAFWFKQWGEWAPGTQFTKELALLDQEPYSRFQSLGWATLNFEPRVDGWSKFDELDPDCPIDDPVYRVGRKRAGRTLDGGEWNEIPATMGV